MVSFPFCVTSMCLSRRADVMDLSAPRPSNQKLGVEGGAFVLEHVFVDVDGVERVVLGCGVHELVDADVVGNVDAPSAM
eukprot:6423065-Amphidinium_carterae.1